MHPMLQPKKIIIIAFVKSLHTCDKHTIYSKQLAMLGKAGLTKPHIYFNIFILHKNTNLPWAKNNQIIAFSFLIECVNVQ